jgi:hypothetical protein
MGSNKIINTTLKKWEHPHTFEKITLKINGDSISVKYIANGINLREQKTRNWTDTVLFKVKEDNLIWIKNSKETVQILKK